MEIARFDVYIFSIIWVFFNENYRENYYGTESWKPNVTRLQHEIQNCDLNFKTQVF